ncbi:hypothetical protein SAMN02745126_03033 [Enhydrobacter aerosaccus]|uniref:Copper chaperone PCu(A)C n=1 Tax=Enhydrobacter aerosaccus TaxID=225324 RepID=A0A1T4PVY2_9HYPH|nr:copper chaperone PCu(A)C [Enhydrobacter aerosaccus]SJZ95457.1 hypothetical protein SAMN02745126_03033 [Enhydrobacter aerosaccus]
MSIDIGRPWARFQDIGSREAAGFVTLTNKGQEADRLVKATSDIAEKTEIWGIKVVGAVARMHPCENGLNLPVDMAVELKPRGYHLFFQGLRKPLIRGQKIPVTLHFAKAAPHAIELEVEAEGLIGKDTLGQP